MWMLGQLLNVWIVLAVVAIGGGFVLGVARLIWMKLTDHV
jgi:hypothetical protein